MMLGWGGTTGIMSPRPVTGERFLKGIPMDPTDIKTYDDILAFAIRKEQEAADLYRGLAEKSSKPAARGMFEDLMRQEEGHKKALEEKGSDGFPGGGGVEVPDLRMSDYLVDVTVEPDSSYQDILIFAIKNEASAVALYQRLGSLASDAGSQALFAQMAEEEKKHKLRLETEYDEYVLKDN